MTPRSLLRRLTRLTPLAALAVAAACNDSTAPQTFKYGLIAVPAKGTAGSYRTRPAGFFFRDVGRLLPSSQITQDSCGIFPYSADPGGSTAGLDYLDAGAEIAVTGGAAPAALVKQILGDGTQVYTTSDTAGLDFTPGGSLTFAVPGARAHAFTFG